MFTLLFMEVCVCGGGGGGRERGRGGDWLQVVKTAAQSTLEGLKRRSSRILFQALARGRVFPQNAQY